MARATWSLCFCRVVIGNLVGGLNRTCFPRPAPELPCFSFQRRLAASHFQCFEAKGMCEFLVLELDT